jgi:hypothetical protein
MTDRTPTLCASCAFVRHVNGRRGQTYLLCRNENIAAKYPRQPILTCPGYQPKTTINPP